MKLKKREFIALLAIVSVILHFGCTRPHPTAVEYDGLRFELPMRVDSAIARLGLEFECYSGFYVKENEHEPSEIITQLKGQPLFFGDDHLKEADFYEEYFVGISFFKAHGDIAQIRDQVEKKYGGKFMDKTKDFGVTRTKPPFFMKYALLKTADGLFVALKEIERGPESRPYVSVSYYKGIPEYSIEKYLEYVR